MRTFRTHLVINKRDRERITQLKFEHVKVYFVDEPSTCYWESGDGKSSSVSYGGRDPKTIGKEEVPLSELIIEAETDEIADDFIAVVLSGMLLAFPEASIIENFVFLREYNEEDNWAYQEEVFFSHLKKFDDVGFGCLVASKILGNNELVYALEKYKISLHLTSFNPYSANPRYKQIFNNYTLKREYHAKAAFAIIAAFSVIEELGLEIRSSQKNPRFIDNEKGEWNPEVLQSIQKRLVEKNLKDDMTFDWIYRGEPQELNKISSLTLDSILNGQNMGKRSEIRL